MMDTVTAAIGGYILLMFVALAVSVTRDGWALPVAGMTVVYLWVFGEIAAQTGWNLPTRLYLSMDLSAAVGFWVWGGTIGARVFAATFVSQAALSCCYMVGLLALSPMEYWWLHAASGYVQLFVLIGWAWIEGKNDG